MKTYFLSRWFCLTGRHRQAYWLCVRHGLRHVRSAVHPKTCSWCSRRLRFGNPALPVSHGLCPACKAGLFAEIGVPLESVNRCELAAKTARTSPRSTFTFPNFRA